MNLIVKDLDHANSVLPTAPMINLQSVLVGDQGRPHVVARQPLVDLPGLVQHANLPFGIDPPQEMHAPGGNGQGTRQHANVFRRQAHPRGVLLGLRGRQPAEGRGLIAMPIPGGEFRAGAFDLGHTVEAAAVPKALTPQPIELLAHAIALGFVHRQKERFDPHIQTQPDQVAKHPRHFVPPTKGRIVIHLQPIGQAQRLPGLQRMLAHGRAGLIRTNRLLYPPGGQINGVEGKHLGSSFQVAAGPVHRLQHVVRGGGRLGEVPRDRWSRRLEHPRVVQDAPNGRERRESPEQVGGLQLLPDGLRPDQPHLAVAQAQARLDHQAARAGVVATGQMTRAARVAFEPVPPEPRKPPLPLVPPCVSPPQTLKDLLPTYSPQGQTNGLAAQRAFVFLVHTASWGDSMKERRHPRCVEPSLSYPVRDVVNLLCPRCHEHAQLSTEMAISIENARLYRSLEEANERLADYSKNLEQKVEERTQALQEKNQELEVANQQVQEASRRKSQFLAGMSHELRTPMNAILGFTRLVLRRAGDLLPERQRDNLVKVQESANHLLNLINQLLDLSRLEAGRMEAHPELFDVKRFLGGCCELLAPLLKPDVALKHELADSIGDVYTDEEGLRHVVVNLLSNAIKFTDAGEVVVRAQVTGQADGDATLVITVADSGIGIPPDALGTIFEEFQQVEGGVQKREGTGLGLPIAKKWVELLGGSIRVESELGKGSTFTVSIPVVYREQEISTESRVQ